MSETESPWRCKVIVLRREAGRVRFGLVQEPREASGLAFAAMPPGRPFPNLLTIDRALEDFAREALGLERVRIHERFVERPERRGAIYYLVEADLLAGRAHAALPAAGPALLWREAAEAAAKLDPPDRAALALAMRYLAGV